MKILLIRPFTDSTVGNSPPLSIMYISSYLKSKNMDVVLVDNCIDVTAMSNFSLNNNRIRELVDEIDCHRPQIIGMTLFSSELKNISKLCKVFKEKFGQVYIVLGGPHPTAMPQETLEQIPECDFVVRGEGEHTVYDLINTLSNGEDLRKLKGISFRTNDNGGIFNCLDANTITNLDEIPFPDRLSLMENYRKGKYSSILYGNPSDCIMTSRGCPLACKFCFKIEDQYRSRSVENVLQELEWIMENIRPQSIQVMDDTFTAQRMRCSQILDAIIERKYKCSFKVRSRVNSANEKLLKKMKLAGVDTIVYGLESGSQKMLDAFNKKTKVEQNKKACQLTKKAEINCLGDMILFYPGENRETLKETEEFLKEAKPTAVKFYILTPLPRTEVYEEAKKNGSLMGGWNIDDESPWIKLDDFKDITEMEKIANRMFIKSMLTPGRIVWFFKSFVKVLFLNPIFSLKVVFYALMKKRKY